MTASGPAEALVLDWDLDPWPSTGDRSETFTVSSGDVTVSIGDPNNLITTGATGPPSLETIGSIDPTSISALTGTPSWSQVGNDTAMGNAANAEDSDDGTAVFRFDTPIQSLSIEYRNDLGQGQLQWIGFSSMVFRRAPEPSTALLLGLGLALLARRSRAS